MTDNPLTELYRKTPQSGYSCDMIIIDDVGAPPPTPEQKASMLRLYQDHFDSKILSAFRSNESATKAENGKTATQLFNKSMDYAYQLSKQSRVRNYD